MNTLAAIAVSTAALSVLTLNGGAAVADGGGSSDTWPAFLPLPTEPGTLISQSSTSAVVRSTDTVGVVWDKLDNLYLTEKGCTLRLGVNRPRDYLCHNPATNKTDEVLFTLAALDPTASDPSRSQTNAFFFRG